jgi:Na+/proline symporter
LATCLGLASTALQLPINAAEAGAGLVPPAVATELMGTVGSALILVMLFMAIVSTGSAESMAVSSLVSYDIYREYINPQADGEQILFISRLVVVLFGVFMGCFSIILFELGLNLGWVYLFMGVMIGSAVAPLWNLLTWKKASGTGAVIAAWSGLALALTAWMSAAKIYGGSISIATLGSNSAMLTGNLVAILSSALIHWAYSTFIDPQDYNFGDLDKHISLVEDDQRGLTDNDPEVLEEAEQWTNNRVYILILVLLVIWPTLAIPAKVFSQGYFGFWVMIAILWGFGAAAVIMFLPLFESSHDIAVVLNGIMVSLRCRKKSKMDDDEGSQSSSVQEVPVA